MILKPLMKKERVFELLFLTILFSLAIASAKLPCPEPYKLTNIATIPSDPFSNPFRATLFNYIKDFPIKWTDGEGNCRCNGTGSGCYNNSFYLGCNFTCHLGGFTVEKISYRVINGDANAFTFSLKNQTPFIISEGAYLPLDFYLDFHDDSSYRYKIEFLFDTSLTNDLVPVFNATFYRGNPPGCEQDSECPESNSHCDVATGGCVSCLVDAHCPLGGCEGNQYRASSCVSGSCSSALTDCTDCSCSCGGYDKDEEEANKNCNDGKDNDCDGKIDNLDVNCPSCTPKNCSLLGHECGSWDDGCGKVLSCGTCENGLYCNSGKCGPRINLPKGYVSIFTENDTYYGGDLVDITGGESLSDSGYSIIKNTGSIPIEGRIFLALDDIIIFQEEAFHKIQPGKSISLKDFWIAQQINEIGNHTVSASLKDNSGNTIVLSDGALTGAYTFSVVEKVDNENGKTSIDKKTILKYGSIILLAIILLGVIFFTISFILKQFQKETETPLLMDPSDSEVAPAYRSGFSTS
jgi:hypothetical protein